MQQEALIPHSSGPFRHRLAEPGLIALLEYWCGMRSAAGGRLPPRRKLDPMGMRKLLPYIEVYRLMPDGRLRCCLSGTAIRNETGREHTGLYLDEMLPKEACSGRATMFLQALETGLPVAYRCGLPIPGREHKSLTRLLLPLADDEGEATIIVSMLSFHIAPISLTRPAGDPAVPAESFTAEESELASLASHCAAA